VLLEITRRHFSDERPWEQTELAARFGASLGNLIDEFVRAGILLRSAEPEGIALARSPEMITVTDVLDIVRGPAVENMQGPGPIAEILLRRDQIVHKAFEEDTLKSLVEKSQPIKLNFPHSG
jgi:DNA-binding IscR family transcriptional regulator